MVTNHFKSFPVVESHYCRAKSNKQHLDGSLTLTKMYDLYKFTENPVMRNLIYGFLNLRKISVMNTKEIKSLNNHQKKESISKNCTSKRKIGRFEERTNDRQIINGITDVAFDLENIVSSFYYFCKLNVYN